jgi:hypothetical protein
MSKTAELLVTSPNKLPILTAGVITPEVLRRFENACRSYFISKDGLEPEDYVKKMAGAFQDDLISDWYWTSADRFNAMSFETFMDEVKEKWLKSRWEGTLRR